MNSTLSIASQATKSGIHALKERKAQRQRDNYTTLLQNARDLEEAREAARQAVSGEVEHAAGGKNSQKQLNSLAEQARRRLDEAVAEANKRKEEAAKATKEASKKAQKSAKKAAKKASKEAKKAAAQAKELASDAAESTSEALDKAGAAAAGTFKQVKDATASKTAELQDSLEKQKKQAKKEGKKQHKKFCLKKKKAEKKAEKKAKRAKKTAQKQGKGDKKSGKVLRRVGLVALLASLAYGIYYLVTQRSASSEPAATPPKVEDYENDVTAAQVRETQEKVVYSSETPIFDEVANGSEPLEGAAQRDEELLQALEEQLAHLESEGDIDPETPEQR